jgi:hypothetical protein
VPEDAAFKLGSPASVGTAVPDGVSHAANDLAVSPGPRGQFRLSRTFYDTPILRVDALLAEARVVAEAPPLRGHDRLRRFRQVCAPPAEGAVAYDDFSARSKQNEILVGPIRRGGNNRFFSFGKEVFLAPRGIV